ncbi:MAG: glycosyltransferase family 4 protein [Bryobacterales bacterium]|nr:glycosyltransferase family 4 protein [Bryobacterales bacterium]
MTKHRNTDRQPQPAARPEPRAVIMISHTYPPVLGGTEIEVQRVAKGLMRRGHRALVLCAGGAPMPKRGDWTDPMGVPVRILTSKSGGTLAALAFSLGVAWSLLQLRRGCRTVYFLMPGLHLAAGLPVAALLGYRIFMKFSGSNTIRPLLRSQAGRWELRFLRWLRVPVMLLNDGMVEEAEAAGIPRSQTLFMPNPVDVDVFAPVTPERKALLREQLQLPKDGFVVIYTGRLSSEKGLLDLLDGFAKAANRPEVHLVLVGDGAQRAELEARARAVEGLPPRITFAGRVDSSAVPLWLQASDAFALVSPNEGFSCALSEAMAVGLPAVVSDIPANRQLVTDGVHGFTTAVGDTDAIARGFLQLQADSGIRKRMAAAAREEIVQKYSTDQVVDRYEKLFEGAK